MNISMKFEIPQIPKKERHISSLSDVVRRYFAAPIAGVAIALAPNMSAAETPDVQSAQVAKTTPESSQKFRENQERVAIKADLLRKFREGNFLNEKEVLELIRSAAKEHREEVGVSFGKSASGQILVGDAHFGTCSGVTGSPHEERRHLEELGVKDIVSAHSHPVEDCQDVNTPENVSLEITPPSAIDVNNLIVSTLGGDYSRHLVVDSQGTWEYSVDVQNTFVRGHIDAMRSNFIERCLQKGIAQNLPSGERELALLETIDAYMSDKNGEVLEIMKTVLKIRTRSEMKVLADEMLGIFEYWNDRDQQENVDIWLNIVSKRENKEYIKEFIAWYEKRGIRMSYVPFEKR